jgi:hypothetical protein
MIHGKMVLSILLLCIASGLYAQNKSRTPDLTGKWVSKSDPGYTLLIKNGWIYEYHENNHEVDTCRYDITNRPCSPGKPNDKKSLFLRKRKAGSEGDCYKLLSHSSNAFVMSAGGRSATWHFIRYLKSY